MFDKERRLVQILDLEEFCSVGSSEGGNYGFVREDDESVDLEVEKLEFMEEGEGCDRVEKFLIDDFVMEKEYEEIEIFVILIVKLYELMGFKLLLYCFLFNLLGEEVIEFLCVEVENESLLERFQDVELELEFMGCGREGMLEREDGGLRVKRRRLQV